MANDPPIDGEFGLDYQIFILRQMANELPEGIRASMLAQLDEVVKAVAIRQKLIVSLIVPKLEDLRVDVKALEFDRHATAQERDDLEERLKKLLGDDFQI